MIPRLAPLLLLTLAACADDGTSRCNGGGGEASLRGSYCEDVEMAFTEVRLRKFVDADVLRIEYRRPPEGSAGGDTTLEIQLPGQGVVLAPEVRITLAAAGATVRRLLSDPQGIVSLTESLDLDASYVLFSAYSGEVGSEAKGEFAFLFTSGRTLSGTFSGTILDARQTVSGP